MIETKYEFVPTELCENYFDVLIGKIYKLLPLKEAKAPTLNTYFISLLNEMTGNKELILLLKNDGLYMSVMSTLENLQNCEDVKFFRSEIFKCITTIKKLRDKYFCKDANNV